jgi:hypothetical protein
MITITLKVHIRGIKFWRKDGMYHRNDGPAIIHESGNKIWWSNGKRIKWVEV